MISTKELHQFVSEVNKLHFNNIYIFNKAQELPECRKNILTVITACIDKHITNLLYDLISNRPVTYSGTLDRCKEFLLENDLANEHFTEFIMAISKSIEISYIRKIQDISTSNSNIIVKVTSIVHLCIEFINLLRIEIEAFNISCNVLGNSKLCNNEICVTGNNVVHLMVTDEFVYNPTIIESIINTFEFITDPKNVILIVDYRNLCDYVEGYNWEETNAYCRYTKCKKYFKEIYFYKYSNIDFGKYYDELKDYLIKDKKQLKQIIGG